MPIAQISSMDIEKSHLNYIYWPNIQVIIQFYFSCIFPLHIALLGVNANSGFVNAQYLLWFVPRSSTIWNLLKEYFTVCLQKIFQIGKTFMFFMKNRCSLLLVNLYLMLTMVVKALIGMLAIFFSLITRQFALLRTNNTFIE